MAKRTNKPTRITSDPEMLLLEYSRQIRALATRLRRLTRHAVPEAIEKVYPGWLGIDYYHPQSGNLSDIFPQPDRSKLGFEHWQLTAGACCV